MPRGILIQDETRAIFYEHYEGIERPIGKVFVTGPIGTPEHYIIKWDSENNGNILDVNVTHSLEEALRLAHDYALKDLSGQTSGCGLEDRTQFSTYPAGKQLFSQLEKRTEPTPEQIKRASAQGCGHTL